MRVVGFEKQSMVDYPGRLAAVMFTPGCNFDCHYCHNRHLLAPAAEDHAMDLGDILEFLHKRRNWLEGIVVSGGEPTLQVDLVEFIATELRPLGLPIKLDTNGTHPEMLEEILERQLVDFVAMDVKAPADQYSDIAQVAVDLPAVERSIDLLLTEAVDYEFRTTFAPPLGLADIVRIARRIAGARRFMIQQYRPVGNGMDMFGVVAGPQPHPADTLHRAMELAMPFVRSCSTRGLPEMSTSPASKPAESHID